MSSLKARLEQVRRRVERAAERCRREPSEIRLIAVSKTVPAPVIMEAYRLGQREFGENRVQEARDKRQELDAAGLMKGAIWHLVGHLQSNKVRPAVDLFDIIQSVDSVKLAHLLNRHAGESGRKLAVLLQVDYTSEPQRSGFEPEELDAAMPEMLVLDQLEIQGLMTVAPVGLDQESLRRLFRGLRLMRDRLALRYSRVEWRHLSMGMSEDFELAIEEGATMVRIGRAIFGERPPL